MEGRFLRQKGVVLEKERFLMKKEVLK